MTFSNPITGGQGALVRPAIKSPNYMPGAAGWSINRDGTAEFGDLSIRSSDGSGSTVTVANGRLTITNAAGVVVVDMDADGYRLYDGGGDIVAEIMLDAGGFLGGFYSRGFQTPSNIYSYMAGGEVAFGPVDNAEADIHGFIQYVMTGIAESPYAALTLSTGALDWTTDDQARVQLISERGQTPVAWVDGGSSAVRADLRVTGKAVADNIRSGRAQAPAPGTTPGQTFVDVVFSSPMVGTPDVVATAESASADLDNSNIRWAISGVSSTGFRLNCWRDTNAATNFQYIAITE